MLSSGKHAIVDDADLELVNQCKWYFSHGYAQRNLWNDGKICGKLYLHRFLMDAKPGQFVDHINRNTLDNRRENLRFCTHRQNMQNSRKRVSILGRKPSSQYKGVSWDKRSQRWVARIHSKHGKYLWLGSFVTEREAYDAYCVAATSEHGSFLRVT